MVVNGNSEEGLTLQYAPAGRKAGRYARHEAAILVRSNCEQGLKERSS